MTIKKRTTEATRFLNKLVGELTFANLLISIRQSEELSQVAFAKQLKVSRQYVCDIEHGRRFVSPKAAADFAKRLGYSVPQFVRLCLQDMVTRDGLKLSVEVRAAA